MVALQRLLLLTRIPISSNVGKAILLPHRCQLISECLERVNVSSKRPGCCIRFSFAVIFLVTRLAQVKVQTGYGTLRQSGIMFNVWLTKQLEENDTDDYDKRIRVANHRVNL